MRIDSAITLYAHSSHHLSHRVRLVMAEKKLNYQLIIVNGEQDNGYDDLSDINPYNSTPTLVERDLVLYENRVIIDYLEERFKGIKILPDNPQERALMRQYAWRLEKDWLRLADILLTHPDSINETEKQQARTTLTDSLITMSPLFAQNPYFLSDSFGLCDCLLAPIFWRLEEMQISLPAHLCRPLLQYCERVFDRAAFQESLKTK